MPPVFTHHQRVPTAWMDEALCVQWPERDAFVQPPFWSTVVGTTSALSALMACRGCSVKDECLAFVQPARSHFDGIAGGKAWREGKHSPPPEPQTLPKVVRDMNAHRIYEHGQHVARAQRKEQQ